MPTRRVVAAVQRFQPPCRGGGARPATTPRVHLRARTRNRRKKMRIATIAVAVLAAAACAKTVKVQTDPSTGHVDVDTGRPGAMEGWTGTLHPVAGSGVSGTARGTSGHDMTMVTVSVTGAQPGSHLPWHVHEGKCGEG